MSRRHMVSMLKKYSSTMPCVMRPLRSPLAIVMAGKPPTDQKEGLIILQPSLTQLINQPNLQEKKNPMDVRDLVSCMHQQEASQDLTTGITHRPPQPTPLHQDPPDQWSISASRDNRCFLLGSTATRISLSRSRTARRSWR